MKTVRTKQGTADELRAWLATADPEAWEQPQPVPGQPGRWTVRYVVDAPLATTAPRSAYLPVRQPARRSWLRRHWRPVVAVTVIALAALGWAVVTVVLWVLANLALVVGLLLASCAVAGWIAYERRCKTCGR